MGTKVVVLVVDDEPEILTVVESRLKAGGYEVITASDGEEGLKKCKLSKPDIAVLDIMMPGMTGDSLAEAMKDDPALCNIPVIFLTAMVKRHEVAKGRAIGGRYYLAKPFKGEELLDLLWRVRTDS